MKLSMVFDADPELGSDPNDPYHRPYRLGEFFDTDKCDVVILVRQWSERFKDGYETQVWTSGIWENVDQDQIHDVLSALAALPEHDDDA